MPIFKTRLNSEHSFSSKLNISHNFSSVIENFLKDIPLALNPLKYKGNHKIHDGKKIEQLKDRPLKEYDSVPLKDFMDEYLHIRVKEKNKSIKYKIITKVEETLSLINRLNPTKYSEKIELKNKILVRNELTPIKYIGKLNFNDKMSYQFNVNGLKYIDDVNTVLNKTRIRVSEKYNFTIDQKVKDLIYVRNNIYENYYLDTYVNSDKIFIMDCIPLIEWDEIPLADIDTISLYDFCYRKNLNWTHIKNANKDWKEVSDTYNDWYMVKRGIKK